ncbi:MAG: NADH:ubiquinone reductase (Na(+)-transporting) subunit C [Prevotella sp.]|jgi:Na+-transporting NADH:ubiquinone oxidoreductase subunit C
MKTNSNSYTIAYSAILVIIVAFLLAFVFQALKPAQDANVALDKKKQILSALNIRDLSNEEADAKYKEVVKADVVFTTNDESLQQDLSKYTGEDDGFKLNSQDYKQGKLALFVCDVNGQRKYVIPVYGMGLWGPIWGYIAMDADFGHVYGAYFNHESETAGLGAEIKDNRSWQEKFRGKKVLDADNNVILGVSKEAKKHPDSEVDAVTGATLTSNGVDAMLKDCISKYKSFIEKNEGVK